VPAETLRPILSVLDTEPVLSAELLALSCWAQRYYHHPPGEVFTTLLPVLLRQGQAARRKAPLLWRLTTAGHTALAKGVLRRAQRQRELLEYLAQDPAGVSSEQLRSAMPAGSGIARVLRDKGWLEQVEVFPCSARQITSAPPLNAAQQAAVTAVCSVLGSFSVFLLDGVTGSGKTEVYLRIVEAVLAQRRQALVLVPEIGLTPQLLVRFATRFPGPMAVLHSGLSQQERLNAWLLARDGTASVVIGTRSAIFTPLKNPGVIIVDEEHDISFKQQEGFRYHARDLSVMRARQAAVPVLLGSATPSLESLFNMQRGRYQRLCLPNRVGNAVPPPIEVLDVRRQPMEEGLSIPLLHRMHTHLAQQGQVLLFLNRRGFAPTLICHE
jgi:primosomal protein N' (replication factor Y)